MMNNVVAFAAKQETPYVSRKDTAKLIRADLKKAFPGIKFSVRGSVASMVSAIDVSWTDGPTEAQVDRIVMVYCGQGFDGMTDSTTYHDTFDPKTGVKTDYGVTHIGTHRRYSDAFRARVEAKLALTGSLPTNEWERGNAIHRAAYNMNATTGCVVKFR